MTELLARAQRQVALVARATPIEFERELASLEGDYLRGQTRAPRFSYEPAQGDALESELLRLAEALARDEHPLADAYRAKAAELALEHRMTTVVGTRALWPYARQRYRTDEALAAEADALATAWLKEATSPSSSEPLVTSDDTSDPRSLVARLTEEIGRRRWAVRVVTSDRITALAATGDGVVVVAKGRALTVEDVERTVLHELEGHAAPRERALACGLGLLRVGTARGSDDQEGLALRIEERGGHLGSRRRRELALRHRAARAVECGRDFVATVTELRDLDASLPTALRIAARAHRGGGLARESVYLPAFVDVRRAIAATPAIERVLSSGRVAVSEANRLMPFVEVTTI